MRKASKILLILGAVFSVVTCLSLIENAIGFATAGFFTGIGLSIGYFASGMGEEVLALLIMGISYFVSFNIVAIVMLVTAIFPLISAILGFIGGAKPRKKKAIYIVNIVFAILLALNFTSGYGLVSAVLILVGSFLALSALKEEKALEEVQEEPVVEEVSAE